MKPFTLIALALLLIAAAFTIVIAFVYARVIYINPGSPQEEAFSKYYVGKTSDECSRIRFVCSQGWEQFQDEHGCGCSYTGKNITKPTPCIQENRNVEICTKEYQPVCGWFDESKIQCIRYPCAQTYGNACEACKNPDILSWSEGACPPG